MKRRLSWKSLRSYNALLSTQAADEILAARAEVAVAQERYYAALDRMSGLQTSDYDPAVTAAQGAVDQAQQRTIRA